MVYNAISGIEYTGKGAEKLENAGFSDPRWLTEKQAKSAAGFYRNIDLPRCHRTRSDVFASSGVPKYSGVKRSELEHGVKYTIWLSRFDKKTGDEKSSVACTFVLYNIEQCWGISNEVLANEPAAPRETRLGGNTRPASKKDAPCAISASV